MMINKLNRGEKPQEEEKKEESEGSGPNRSSQMDQNRSQKPKPPLIKRKCNYIIHLN